MAPEVNNERQPRREHYDLISWKTTQSKLDPGFSIFIGHTNLICVTKLACHLDSYKAMADQAGFHRIFTHYLYPYYEADD